MTSPLNFETKAKHVKATWGKRCNKLLFMSSEANEDLPAVKLHIPEGRNFLWGKTKLAFKHIYENYFNASDWFVKADDDSYLVMENLRLLLKDYNPKSAIYLGRHFNQYIPQGYMSGGAGYVLSKEALYRFATLGLQTEKPRCRKTDGGAEDLEMGICMQRLGVQTIDSRDLQSRQRFHPFRPALHVVPDVLSKDLWLYTFDMYPLITVTKSTISSFKQT